MPVRVRQRLEPRERRSSLRDRYLDLLIGALTHTLYAGRDRLDFPPEMIERLRDELPSAEDRRALFDRERNRTEGRDWPLYGQTMIGLQRMRNLRRCAEVVVSEQIPGDLIEAGVWRGGAAILMRGVLEAYAEDQRCVWLADSFEGLPAPDVDRYPADRGDQAHSAEQLAVSAQEVRENFRRYGLLDDRVRFVEGWFRDTLPSLRDRSWSLIRLDGDMYESTMDGLVNLYDGLSPGGFLIVDDFGLAPCRKAVEDFRRERGIAEPIEEVDWTGAFWRKRT
jgi:O-methyltransferase